MATTRVHHAIELMSEFADRTGLTSSHAPRRYLWTDAFAVCNFLGLWRATGDTQFRDLAERLVHQVHHTLGRHRSDSGRSGWISGLDDTVGEQHPTLGGLRIGKPRPERTASEPYDERAEWDRDGQYFHYLTKWMHALDQVTRATGDVRYHVWARELADTAWQRFVYCHAGRCAMYWKLSIDLSRHLVHSMGQHDPLDGFVACVELQATAPLGPDLTRATEDYASMLDRDHLMTIDPLGIGGLLESAHRLAQLSRSGVEVGNGLHLAIVRAARAGLHGFLQSFELRMPAHSRLAFRELGLAIGLATEPNSSIARTTRASIESFWLDPHHRHTRSWQSHRDISDVMLATCLVPEGYLALHSFTRDEQQLAAP